MEYLVSKASEEELQKFLRDNYIQFGIVFERMSEDTNYSHKLFTKSVRYELWNQGELSALLCVYYNQQLSQAYIPYLCVSKKYKGQGLGTLLLNNLISVIKKDYDFVRYIALEVVTDNEPAKRLYSKFLFKEISRNSSKIQMRKII